jgi:hypothetical protein
MENISQPNSGNRTNTPPVPDRTISKAKYENYTPKVNFSVMNEIGMDLGYSTSKLSCGGELSTEPTAISFAVDLGIEYGESHSYIYENEDLYVGQDAIGEAFTTLDYKFKYKYDPVLIFHNLYKLGALNIGQSEQNHITLRVGLALADWKNKDEYIKRISEITVDGKTYKFNNIKIIPQGAGAYLDYVVQKYNGEHPGTCSIVDLGYNTINFLNFADGKPLKQNCRSYAGHGVSSIIKSFTNYLETKFGMNFSEQEAMVIFMRNKFVYNGVEQTDVPDMILELKNNFLKKLRNSILVKEKKLLSTSEKVVFAGGGANLLKGVAFPPNVDFCDNSVYANVRGYILA